MITKNKTLKAIALLGWLSALVFGSFVVSYNFVSITYFLVLMWYMIYYVRLKNTQ